MKKRVLTLLAVSIGILPLMATSALSVSADVPAQLEEVASSDPATGYVFPAWNEFNMTFSLDGNVSVSQNQMNILDATVTIDVEVDVPSTFVFTKDWRSYSEHRYMNVFHNDELVLATDESHSEVEHRHFIELAPGKHTIQFQGNILILDIGVAKTPLITVNLLEPGSLNTEILYNVDHLKEVRCLKIKGKMNDDDWNIIKMMNENLFTLDLSEAITTEVPDECFYDDYSNYPVHFLYAIVLPEGLKRIGNRAFCRSSLKNVNIPSTLQSIGEEAFYVTCITTAILPESCVDLGDRCFMYCQYLTDMALSDKITVIPNQFSSHCNNLKPFSLPKNLMEIKASAFEGSDHVYFEFPESLTTIGDAAFRETNLTWCEHIDSLIIPKNVTSLGKYTFENTGYVYAELPVSFYEYRYNPLDPQYMNGFLDSNIMTLRINCATVLDVSKYSVFLDKNHLPNVTLQVPQHLVNSYKSDGYWYNAKSIEGFSTEEIDHWNIRRDLVLDARSRLLGTPSIKIYGDGSLKINGETGMTINNLLVDSSPEDRLYTSRFISNADNVTVEGDLITYFQLVSKGKWYYICLPYDIKVSDIQNDQPDKNSQCAIRYYDGGSRAINGASGNWKNYEADDIIPAGTGFIMQVSEAAWWRFPAQNNESKQYMTSYKMFVKGLAENPSENPSDRGWNLVGNPYQAFYNIHKMNFTAPITVRENNKYAAYSIIDDDYALAPNQAFFVQCPEGLSEISFPLDGRQMTDEIESQVGAKPMNFANKQTRQLTDITLTSGEQTDRTRVVLNEQATMGYDMSADAGKFMGDAGVSQIYSHDGNGTSYAINERPAGNGTVYLGFVAGEDGCFSISVTRNNGGRVMLVDNEQGITTDITSTPYEFTATAGTYEKRFELRLGNSGVTDMDNVVELKDKISVVDNGINAGVPVEVYNMAGVKVAETEGGSISLASGHYLIKAQGSVVKVYVK